MIEPANANQPIGKQLNQLSIRTPPRSLFAVASAMFRDLCYSRIGDFEIRRKERQTSLRKIYTVIRKAADLLIGTESKASARALEAKIEKLEAHSALILENLAKTTLTVNTLDGLDSGGEKMAEHWGGGSNHWDDFFAELERWEEVLSTRGELPEDCTKVSEVPPD